MDFLKLKKKLRKYLPKWFFNFLIEIVWRKIINPFRMLSKNFKNVYCICDKRKIVFFIIGKNACSSIKKTFYKKKFEDNYSIHKNENRKFFLSKKEKTYFKFAFIRNPFDRVYSCYKSKFINDKKKYSIELNYFYSYLFGYLRNCKNFNDFLFKINKIPNFLADRHFKSQYSLLYKNNKCLVDYIGRFENLEKDFEPIRKKYKLEKLPSL